MEARCVAQAFWRVLSCERHDVALKAEHRAVLKLLADNSTIDQLVDAVEAAFGEGSVRSDEIVRSADDMRKNIRQKTANLPPKMRAIYDMQAAAAVRSAAAAHAFYNVAIVFSVRSKGTCLTDEQKAAFAAGSIWLAVRSNDEKAKASSASESVTGFTDCEKAVKNGAHGHVAIVAAMTEHTQKYANETMRISIDCVERSIDGHPQLAMSIRRSVLSDVPWTSVATFIKSHKLYPRHREEAS